MWNKKIYPRLKMDLKVLSIVCIMLLIHQWNCQSLNAHGAEYIQSLKTCKYLPNIICLQETFLCNR